MDEMVTRRDDDEAINCTQDPPSISPSSPTTSFNRSERTINLTISSEERKAWASIDSYDGELNIKEAKVRIK